MLSKKQENKIREVFGFYRGLILDLLEQEIGDGKNWTFVRGRILKILSPDRGLESKVFESLVEGVDHEQSL